MEQDYDMKYYDRQGRPMHPKECAELAMNVNYLRVAATTLPDGKWVSTVWLGMDHRNGRGLPLIFETMVFPGKREFASLDVVRYTTEAEAVAGHAAMVAKWSKEKRQ